MPNGLDGLGSLYGLDGQVALVTGGAGGLGSEAATWLAAAGARVVVADVSAASLERAAEPPLHAVMDRIRIVPLLCTSCSRGHSGACDRQIIRVRPHTR